MLSRYSDETRRSILNSLKFVDEMLREAKEYRITIIEFRNYERMNESFSGLEGEKFPFQYFGGDRRETCRMVLT